MAGIQEKEGLTWTQGTEQCVSDVSECFWAGSRQVSVCLQGEAVGASSTFWSTWSFQELPAAAGLWMLSLKPPSRYGSLGEEGLGTSWETNGVPGYTWPCKCAPQPGSIYQTSVIRLASEICCANQSLWCQLWRVPCSPCHGQRDMAQLSPFSCRCTVCITTTTFTNAWHWEADGEQIF